MPLQPEIQTILRELNPWWEDPNLVRPRPQPYRRRRVLEIQQALRKEKALIHALRGPRQVGKTTALYQIVEAELKAGRDPRSIILIRFDLPQLQDCGLHALLDWVQREVSGGRSEPFGVLLLDEVHKLPDWAGQIKHVHEIHQPHIVITGSSSVLVARGQRESLAWRARTVEFPPFLFREVLETWQSQKVEDLPAPLTISGIMQDPQAACAAFDSIRKDPPQRLHSMRRDLERYFSRGGYPRLHSGEIQDDDWQDYLLDSVFDRVLGLDIPELFPIQEPRLLRHVYLEIARRTGQEITQVSLAEACNVAGFRTSQPVVGRYLHYLADALLIREFRRYPLAKKSSSRTPSKITLTDLGMRNAIFRGAPSLYESSPADIGPLVETLVQTVLQGTGLQVHFYRGRAVDGDRASPIEEVDYVAESADGAVLPIEVKFRKRIDGEDGLALARFAERYQSAMGIMVTRDLAHWDADRRILHVPLMHFMLAF